MMKNRYFAAFAVAAMVGLAACETEPETTTEEIPVTETTVPAAEAPVMTAPAGDTMGAVPTETAPVVVDTNPAAPQP